MYTRDELLTLSRAYMKGTGRSSSWLSMQTCGSAKFFRWIEAGRDSLLSNAELASEWFDRNWPRDKVPWPREVRPSGRRWDTRIGSRTSVRSEQHTTTPIRR